MGKTEKIEKASLKNQLSSLLDVPSEVVSDLPKITLMGFKELQVENYKSLLEYTIEKIRINTASGMLIIEGRDLQALRMTDELIQVKGKIMNVSFMQ